MRDHPARGEKFVCWVGSSKRDLLQFPDSVVDEIGTALSVAQFGGSHHTVKPWRGEGPGMLEIVANHDRATYRAVYTVQFEEAIYVLHCFQKKSPTGIRTARPDINLITKRLRQARVHYEENYGSRES